MGESLRGDRDHKMGKRKSSKPLAAKKKAKLETIFDCPFCNHEKTIEIQIKRAKQTSLQCRMCGVNWGTDVHDLMKPIDVFTAWIDECDAANPSDEEGTEDKGTLGRGNGLDN